MTTVALMPGPREVARRARLRYATDDAPGLRRVAQGRGFAYKDAHHRLIRDRQCLARIRRLAIPPAWTDVWICPYENGHLQATGRDSRGRKQYIYHPQWGRQASRMKFARLRRFGEALPLIRRQVARHLRLPTLSRKKVIATVIELLDRTLVRVGNEEYARTNDSYGLTTLRDRHAQINGARVRLRFQGKSGKTHEVDYQDRRVARIVRQCQELPGQQLFQYLDADGNYRRLESSDVNRYLQDVTGHMFTAKDFRTWKATAFVLECLRQQAAASLTAAQARRVVGQAIRETAEALGNTVTICRNYYVHPQIVELFLKGKLGQVCGETTPRPMNRMDSSERVLLRLLRRFERQPSKKGCE